MNKKVMIETNKIINIISQSIDKYVREDIVGKEMIVIYDDILPDLFINMPMNDDVKSRYDISIPKKIDIEYVLYDVYAENIKRVKVEFPNGDVEYFDTYYREGSRDDEFYCCVWEIPMITMEYNGVPLELSILDLIDKGAKIFIEKYEI